MGRMTIDSRPSRKGLPEPGAVKAARRGSEGAPAAAMRRGYPTEVSRGGERVPGDGRQIGSRPATGAAADMRARPPREAAGVRRRRGAGGRPRLRPRYRFRQRMISLFDSPSFAAPLGVGEGGRVGFQPGDHDPPQRAVGFAVPAAVEPVPAVFPEEEPGSGRRRTGAPTSFRCAAVPHGPPAATSSSAAVSGRRRRAA